MRVKYSKLRKSGRIESMKMETVIRSPQKGVIAKLVHKAGVSDPGILCRAITDLNLGHLQSWHRTCTIRRGLLPAPYFVRSTCDADIHTDRNLSPYFRYMNVCYYDLG